MCAQPRIEPRAIAGKRVLLVGTACGWQDLRARALRVHGVEVDVAKDASQARALWKPGKYDMVLIDVRKHWPGEAHEFGEELRASSANQRIAFLTGPPEYVSLDWPDHYLEQRSRQWAETARRISTGV